MTSPLKGESGSTPEERAREAREILTKHNLVCYTEQMSPKEADFVARMDDECDKYGVSPKQLFWLRDLKAKYAD